jgi:hypothetical protein
VAASDVARRDGERGCTCAVAVRGPTGRPVTMA